MKQLSYEEIQTVLKSAANSARVIGAGGIRHALEAEVRALRDQLTWKPIADMPDDFRGPIVMRRYDEWCGMHVLSEKVDVDFAKSLATHYMPAPPAPEVDGE